MNRLRSQKGNGKPREPLGAILGFSFARKVEPRVKLGLPLNMRIPLVSRRIVLLFALFSASALFGQTTANEFNARGAGKRAKGDLEGAIADFTKAIELNPEFAAAYNNRGAAKRLKGDHDGALADFTRAIELDPNLASAYGNRANIRKAKGDTAGADADRRKAEELQSREPDR